MPADTLLDDFILSLRIVMRGYTIAYCADAYAVENGSADMHEEEKTQSAYRCRRLAVRLAPACIAQSAALRCVLFSIHIPPRTEMVAYARTVVPAVPPQYEFPFLRSNTPLLYAVIWLLQALFYFMASWGHYLSANISRINTLVPYYFLS